MVSSTHWLASASAMAVLERGGNAFDAAVAAGFVLQVVEPHLNGPGGEVPILAYSAARDGVLVVCGQGVAPRSATIGHFRDLGLELIPGSGLLPACVPGAVGGWLELLGQLGTMRLRDVLEYAIGYAEGGYPLVPRIADSIASMEHVFREEWTGSGELYLPGGAVPRAGSCFRNPALAATWRRLLDEAEARSSDRDAQIEAARDAFYQGFVAEAVDRFVAGTAAMDSTGHRHHGLLTGQDMAAWRAVGPGTRVPPAAPPAGGLRPRGDGAGQRRLRPHRHRVLQAGLRRPRGLVRRPGFRGGPGRRAAGPRLCRRPSGARRRGRLAEPAAGFAWRAEAPAPATGPGGRGAEAGRAGRGHGRRRAHPGQGRPRRQRHLPRRRRRPLREHGRVHPERWLAAQLAGDPGAGVLPGHTGADVLAVRGGSQLPGGRQAATHHPDPEPRPPRRQALARLRDPRRRPAGPVDAHLVPGPPALRHGPPARDRRAELPQRALPELVLSARGQTGPAGGRGPTRRRGDRRAAGTRPSGGALRSLGAGPPVRGRPGPRERFPHRRRQPARPPGLRGWPVRAGVRLLQ